VRWCDRRRGLGADGLLVLGPAAGDTALSMTLFNADGSRAEMSGNGIRCLVHAWVLSHGMPTSPLVVRTDAGLRTVTVAPTASGDTILASVTMGEVTALAEPAGWAALGCDPGRPVLHLSLGNPHSVVLTDDVASVDLAHLGALVPQVNLEIVEPGPEPGAVRMRVHERGVGITEACGTGASAAAFAAARWGLVPAGASEVLVHMDGGDATVRLDAPVNGEVTLVGPSTVVATVILEEPAP